MSREQRKHKRFSATAFLNMKVALSPLAPFFGHPINGRLIDLSAGGMALLIDEIIPQGTRLAMTLAFPDGARIETTVQVKHVYPRDRRYLHGLEFLSIPRVVADRIDKMSADYIDCESRIQKNEPEICRASCAFFNVCGKPQRKEPQFNPDLALELAFKSLNDSLLRS